jgi:hypothetical protein
VCVCMCVCVCVCVRALSFYLFVCLSVFWAGCAHDPPHAAHDAHVSQQSLTKQVQSSRLLAFLLPPPFLSLFVFSLLFSFSLFLWLARWRSLFQCRSVLYGLSAALCSTAVRPYLCSTTASPSALSALALSALSLLYLSLLCLSLSLSALCLSLLYVRVSACVSALMYVPVLSAPADSCLVCAAGACHRRVAARVWVCFGCLLCLLVFTYAGLILRPRCFADKLVIYD